LLRYKLFCRSILGTFLHCFNIAFPYKRANLREKPNKRWLSKGLIVSSKRMKTLNNLKRTFTLTREDPAYIENYQQIYKRLLREAKKRENDRCIIGSMDRTKAMCRLINRKIGKAPENEEKLEIN
jgi:hypothetical protein